MLAIPSSMGSYATASIKINRFLVNSALVGTINFSLVSSRYCVGVRLLSSTDRLAVTASKFWFFGEGLVGLLRKWLME